MQSLKSLSPIVLAILACGPLALVLALHLLGKLKQADKGFSRLARKVHSLEKKSPLADDKSTGNLPKDKEGEDDPEEIEPEGTLSSLLGKFGKLSNGAKAVVLLLAALALIAVGSKLGSKGGDAANEVVAKPAPKAVSVSVAKVNECGLCKPDLSAGGVIDATNDGSYLWANACTGSGDCGKCKPVAACTTKNPELSSAPPGCNACEIR
jgi:hypothetical protein